jgi:malonyl-CoA/methylmalonyl-CoA synthetase
MRKQMGAERHRAGYDAGMRADDPPAAPPTWAAHLPPGSNPSTVDLGAAGTLPAAWSRLVVSSPDRPVLYQAGWGWVTRARLDLAAWTAAAVFHDAGLGQGDRLLVAAATSPALVAIHLAALRSGLVIVPVNPAYTDPEIARIVRSADPAGAVVDDPAIERWLRAASARPVAVFTPDATGLTPDTTDLPTEPAAGLATGTVATPGAPSGGTTGLGGHGDDGADGRGGERDVAQRPGERIAEQTGAVRPDTPALLCYTSGTTSAPKGVVLTHANVLASTAAVALAWRWTERDRLLLALPLFHVHGLAVGVYGTLFSGGSALLFPAFDAGEVLAAARTQDATMLFGVPTMYARLAAHARAEELRRLRLCVSGSAPLPTELFDRIEERTGKRVLERYGMTETLMNVSNPYDGPRRPGTVGLPLPGVEVALEEGSGEILLRGPNVFGGYWRDAEATAAAFTADGWFRSGDLGSLDEAGYLRIDGRRKELIITGGFNVHPREVEEALLGHPAVAEAAVIGVPSEDWGEVVVAYVVPEAGERPTADALLGFAAERLAPYKRPRQVRFVDALPRNALGKILRHELPR